MTACHQSLIHRLLLTAAVAACVLVNVHLFEREGERAFAAGTAETLLNLYTGDQPLTAEKQEWVDTQLRMALFKMAPMVKYSIGPQRGYAVPLRIVKYFDVRRGGAVLFPGESACNSRIAAFVEELRSHPNGRDVSFLVPAFLGLVALVLLSKVAMAGKREKVTVVS